MKYAHKKQFAVLGLGRFGRSVAQTLIKNGCEVLVGDLNANLVQDAIMYSTHAVQVDITDEIELDSIGIGNFDVVIIAIGSDFEAALMATMISKEKGAGFVLAKANGLRQKKILESVGADRVVLPEKEMGQNIAESFLESTAIDYIKGSDKYGVFEIPAIKDWYGKKISETNIRTKYNLNIITIKRNGVFIISLNPDEVILKDDVVVVVGESSEIDEFLNQKD